MPDYEKALSSNATVLLLPMQLILQQLVTLGQ